MELYQLRTFVAVAEEGHVTRASERLFLSQSSVSAHVKALEEELGVALFERGARGVSLTPAGAELLDRARDILLAADGMLRRACALRSEVSGTVRLGLNTGSAFLRVPELLAWLEAEHPRVSMQFMQGSSGTVIEGVAAGGLDAGYAFGRCEDARVAAHVVGRTATRFVAPAVWDRAVHRFDAGADFRSLAALPWIWAPDCWPCYAAAWEYFRRQGAEPTRAYETDSEEVMLNLVTAGKGLCMMREDQAREAEAAGRVVIWEAERLPLDVLFLSRASRADTPLARALLAGVRAVWGPDSAPA
ncbi:MAG: LysR family transcriptional regulator [Desulfovibrionaceae bacterium]